MTEFVRVRDKATRHEYTIPAEAVSDDAHEVVARKGVTAVDTVGRPLAAKHRNEPAPAPAGGNTTRTTDQEESRE